MVSPVIGQGAPNDFPMVGCAQRQVNVSAGFRQRQQLLPGPQRRQTTTREDTQSRMFLFRDCQPRSGKRLKPPGCKPGVNARVDGALKGYRRWCPYSRQARSAIVARATNAVAIRYI